MWYLKQSLCRDILWKPTILLQQARLPYKKMIPQLYQKKRISSLWQQRLQFAKNKCRLTVRMAKRWSALRSHHNPLNKKGKRKPRERKVQRKATQRKKKKKMTLQAPIHPLVKKRKHQDLREKFSLWYSLFQKTNWIHFAEGAFFPSNTSVRNFPEPSSIADYAVSTSAVYRKFIVTWKMNDMLGFRTKKEVAKQRL